MIFPTVTELADVEVGEKKCAHFTSGSRGSWVAMGVVVERGLYCNLCIFL